MVPELKVAGEIPDIVMGEVTPVALLSGIKTWVLLVDVAITVAVGEAFVVVDS
jgi:hypothetical protein